MARVYRWMLPNLIQDLLHGFIGLVGYLADDIPNVRILMSIFELIKWWYCSILLELHWAAGVQWSEGAHPASARSLSSAFELQWGCTTNLDGRATGISGLVSQGDDCKMACIAAFFSTKLSAAQQTMLFTKLRCWLEWRRCSTMRTFCRVPSLSG